MYLFWFIVFPCAVIALYWSLLQWYLRRRSLSVSRQFEREKQVERQNVQSTNFVQEFDRLQYFPEMAAFVVEKIDTPERRAELAQLKLVSPISRSQPVDLRRWCVDRVRGLYFVNFGGNPGIEIPYQLALVDRQGTQLEASGLCEGIGPCLPHSIEVTWIIESIWIDRRSWSRADELMTTLRDALCAYGSFGDPELTKFVTVKLPAPRMRA